MNDVGFHFAQPLWLWGLLLIPLVLLWLHFTRPFRRQGLESRYADAELLPYLIGSAVAPGGGSSRRPLVGWSLAWLLLILAMAGPRWDFRQINLFAPGVDLVILLDISRSMNATDVAPSRLVRARQEIEDLIRQESGIRIGLIAFATVAHVVSPITEDREGLRQKLPAISTQLVRLQGSRLGDALARAKLLFDGQPDETAHNILLISDGDFPDKDLEQKVTELRKAGVRLHVLGIGTAEGGDVPVMMPGSPPLIGRDRRPVRSPLDEAGLERLAELGGGIYRQADYRSDDTGAVVDVVMVHASAQQDAQAQTHVWNERFYWLLIPAMLLLLMLYRPSGSIHRRGEGGGV